jgi:hypothetical protein
MNAKSLRWLGVIVGALLACNANADHGGTPPEFVNAISVFSLPATPPDNVFQEIYPTEVVPNHGKKLGFNGLFRLPNAAAPPTTVGLQLLWIDPRIPQGVQMSDLFVFPVVAGMENRFSTQTFIPFPPTHVGIRIENQGPSGPIVAIGSLVHQTSTVPEPSSLALLVTSGAAVGAAVRNCRQTKRRRGHEATITARQENRG